MKKMLLAIPSILTPLVASLPFVFCPACWPLYTGILSSIGLNFVDYSTYVFPITVTLVIISLFTFAWNARLRNGFKPLFIGSVGSALLLLGKFYLELDLVFYTGVVLLILASIWNIVPKKNCVSCK